MHWSVASGLAETLRQESLLYGIDIHMFFPGTFDSACLQKENETKPKITLKLEVSDPMVSAEQ
jgi:3-dehydrosphinganine reductase